MLSVLLIHLSKIQKWVHIKGINGVDTIIQTNSYEKTKLTDWFQKLRCSMDAYGRTRRLYSNNGIIKKFVPSENIYQDLRIHSNPNVSLIECITYCQ